MQDWYLQWWAWAIFALVLVILEIVAPAFVLLGFGIGAGVLALLLAIFGTGIVGGSFPFALVIFAAVSLAAWLGLRHYFRPAKSEVKIWEDDING